MEKHYPSYSDIQSPRVVSSPVSFRRALSSGNTLDLSAVKPGLNTNDKLIGFISSYEIFHITDSNLISGFYQRFYHRCW